MQNYLEFEKPLAEIEGKAEELRAMARSNAEMDVEKEASALDKKAQAMLADLYKDLSPWRKCQVARHPDRPHCSDYIELRNSFEPYVSYCRRYPDHCDLSGPHIVEINSDTSRLLEVVNVNANSVVHDASDKELYDREEYWAFPSLGAGDCEDISLFKRERLVGLGLPRAAMTIALVHHRKKMFPHAVLLVETTAGTYLLDSLENDIVLWHEAPYNFESRERSDGSWERFDQSIWTYE